jgi:signal transduction histidine kinase
VVRNVSHELEGPGIPYAFVFSGRIKIPKTVQPRYLLISFAVLAAAVLSHLTGAAPTKEVRRILILNEVNASYPATTTITQGIQTALSNSPYHLEFYSEYLDTILFPDPAVQHEFHDFYIRKYRNRQPDVIITVGAGPLKFMQEAHDRAFPSVPVVFCLPIGNVQSAVLGFDFTGVESDMAPAETLQAALRLQPGTEHVVVVGGVSDWDRQQQALLKQQIRGLTDHLDITYITDLAVPDLLEHLKNLRPHTVILLLSLGRDVQGTQFKSSEIGPLVASAANAPVFSFYDVFLNHGEVGGYLSNLDEQGRVAGEMALKILQGARPQDIPRVKGVNTYMFDWQAVKRWGLKESEIPPGSIILNRQPTLWEQHRWTLLIGLLTLATLSLLTIYLLFERKQLDAARNEQMRLTGMLINAQEVERARLASELHDDFSQRLAMLSIGLETAAEIVPESPEEANRQLNALMNSASELGADLHTLSHRLHSSTLETLGLTVGVEAFCKEFTAQRGIQVEFSHKGVPPSVSPDVSLCLFRIVQEGLRNVQKHSGATNAQVRIETMDHTLHLSISDDGAGYDVNGCAGRQGLGLRSMRERVRLVGGRFEIHSKTGKGTRIHVWAPLTK